VVELVETTHPCLDKLDNRSLDPRS